MAKKKKQFIEIDFTENETRINSVNNLTVHFSTCFDIWIGNFGRQCHCKIWLDCHKFKKFSCLIMRMSTKCQKMRKKMTINVIQHDDRL
jgi:hypothetical protein